MKRSAAWPLTLLVICSGCGSQAASPDAGTSGNDAAVGDTGAGADDSGTSPAMKMDGEASSEASSGSPSDSAIPEEAATEDGAPPDVNAPLLDGGELVQFVGFDQLTYFDPTQQVEATGTITFGVANSAAADGWVANLTRTGGESEVGTDGAEEIVSNRMFSFGTFTFRLSFATCTTSEDLVNGPFAYFNDGSLASDGLPINREVDIEVLCGEPWLINLTIWTEYQDDSHCKNQSRVIDTQTGTVYVYADDQSNGVQTGTESHPELMIPGWPQAGAFYELGWTWAADHLTYFLVNDDTELTLWDATDATRIPQASMYQHFNIWAPGESWATGNPEPPPASDSTLTLDWFRYDPL